MIDILPYVALSVLITLAILGFLAGYTMMKKMFKMLREEQKQELERQNN